MYVPVSALWVNASTDGILLKDCRFAEQWKHFRSTKPRQHTAPVTVRVKFFVIHLVINVLVCLLITGSDFLHSFMSWSLNRNTICVIYIYFHGVKNIYPYCHSLSLLASPWIQFQFFGLNSRQWCQTCLHCCFIREHMKSAVVSKYLMHFFWLKLFFLNEWATDPKLPADIITVNGWIHFLCIWTTNQDITDVRVTPRTASH